jgi:hypothetical protein
MYGYKNQEEGKSIGPLMTLRRMVTILRKLNMDHLKFRLISELGQNMEGNGMCCNHNYYTKNELA